MFGFIELLLEPYREKLSGATDEKNPISMEICNKNGTFIHVSVPEIDCLYRMNRDVTWPR